MQNHFVSKSTFMKCCRSDLGFWLVFPKNVVWVGNWSGVLVGWGKRSANMLKTDRRSKPVFFVVAWI